jgi:hypothetical protein
MGLCGKKIVSDKFTMKKYASNLSDLYSAAIRDFRK